MADANRFKIIKELSSALDDAIEWCKAKVEFCTNQEDTYRKEAEEYSQYDDQSWRVDMAMEHAEENKAQAQAYRQITEYLLAYKF